jgi:hypothetical protein
MYVSPTKAIKMYSVSKPTLYSDMKTGKLSYDLTDRKKRKINVAELDRIYDKRETEEGASNSGTVKQVANLMETNVSSVRLRQELEDVRQSLDESRSREVEALKNQIEQQQEQIDLLNKNLNKALDITALLEDKREGQGAKEAKLDAKLEILERQITNMERQNKALLAKEEERKRKLAEQEKQELETEIKKGWFGKFLSK